VKQLLSNTKQMNYYPQHKKFTTEKEMNYIWKIITFKTTLDSKVMFISFFFFIFYCYFDFILIFVLILDSN